jgi:hypothetical protein
LFIQEAISVQGGEVVLVTVLEQITSQCGEDIDENEE